MKILTSLWLASAFQAVPVARRRTAVRAVAVEDVMKCLRREYRSFFDPLEPEYYLDSVTFDDPLNSLSGLGAYRSNVDMLAGRTSLGQALFKDASIALHDVRQTATGLRTRWTLRVEFAALPWRPVARFTGVSDYELDAATGKIAGQRDYWDSIDLQKGDYSRSSKLDGAKDFLDQVLNNKGPLDNELPFELLRRAKGYSVRRYPAAEYAVVNYDVRPEGYDTLGSYAGGRNQDAKKLAPFLPSIITVPKQPGGRKFMRWPLVIDGSSAPEPNTNAVSLKTEPELVVAVLTFTEAATPGASAKYTKQLEDLIERDGLTRAADSADVMQIAQYDAIYSMGERRNEAWIPIEVPDYWRV